MEKKYWPHAAVMMLLWFAGVAGFAYYWQQTSEPTSAYWRVFLQQFIPLGTGLLLYYMVVRPWQGRPPLFKTRGRFRF